MQERSAPAIPGLIMFVAFVLGALVGLSLLGTAAPLGKAFGLLVIVLDVVLVPSGFIINPPNMSRVLTFFGRYVGTVKRTGWSWTYPLTQKQKISLRIQNFDSDTLKVNDASGNPVEISAIVVWKVVDTARAVFDVEDYENFVRVQTETAVRHVASQYPYDSYEEGRPSLQANADDVAATMNAELRTQLSLAGVEVLRTQLRRLAYAPEIATDMLRRQQAEAVVAARFKIVEGAVSMVQEALQQLDANNVVQMDEERKAAMVSNLLVVLCSESHAQPVVNTGTLYQ